MMTKLIRGHQNTRSLPVLAAALSVAGLLAGCSVESPAQRAVGNAARSGSTAAGRLSEEAVGSRISSQYAQVTGVVEGTSPQDIDWTMTTSLPVDKKGAQTTAVGICRALRLVTGPGTSLDVRALNGVSLAGADANIDCGPTN